MCYVHPDVFASQPLRNIFAHDFTDLILTLITSIRLIVNLDALIVSVCLVGREGHLTEIWQLLLDSLPEFKLPEVKPEEEVKEEVNPEQLAPVSICTSTMLQYLKGVLSKIFQLTFVH